MCTWHRGDLRSGYTVSSKRALTGFQIDAKDKIKGTIVFSDPNKDYNHQGGGDTTSKEHVRLEDEGDCCRKLKNPTEALFLDIEGQKRDI